MHFTNPQPRDVLCGRGISCHEHQGNKLLRQLIDRNLRRYAIADSKSDKSSILREIIRSILQEGGRFLKKDSETESYYEAGMKAARDKVGHCLREAMAERYARSKPAIDKTIPNLVPKPLTCSSSTNDAFASFYPQTTTSLNEARHFCMIDSRPSIVSDADVRDISSQDDDDDSSSFSADSLTSTSIFASDEYFSESNATTEVVDALHELPSEGDKAYTSLPRISNTYSAPTDLAEVVDALYELPSQGEWEELILPRANFAFSGISSFIIV